MRIVLDIETNSTHDKIWCVVCRDIDKDVVSTFVQPATLQDFINNCESIVTHNGIFFDFPVLKKVWGIQVKKSQVADTLVLSRLYNPSIEDGHSLEAWGNRLGHYKAPYKKIWSWLTRKSLIGEDENGKKVDKSNLAFDEPVMSALLWYCVQDTKVTAELYKHLTKEMQNDFSKESIDLEHQVAIIIAEQERNGFKLNQASALSLLAELKTKLDIIQVEMETLFPPVVISGRTHGTSGKPLNDIVTPFNPGSRQQIAKRLQEKGWKPKKRTEKGSVIVDEEVLASLDYPEAKALAEYMMLQKRIAQITSWLDAVGKDGRVHGRVITNGAVTGRMTHMSPNMAQVPNSGSPYGHECRDLWTVEKGYKLVGIDASGLELRMLAHYMNDNAYTNEVVSGDIHTANQTAAGLQTRNQAKTFIYAFLYGAGSAKIGSIVGGSAKEGQKLIDSFLRNTPKLKALREKVARIYAQKGWLPGLDGRKLLVRAEHSALNTLLQGAGAIVMKQAVVILHERLRKEKINFKMVANVHDEWQIEVEESRAEEVGIMGKQAISDVVKELKVLDDPVPNPKKRLRCPLDGEYKVGNSWKETH
jgi:DNA polymerase I-like protein with 3'-5' exonuclease and polymerase domains